MILSPPKTSDRGRAKLEMCTSWRFRTSLKRIDERFTTVHIDFLVVLNFLTWSVSLGDDQIWEAVDNEFYDPQQITTSNGHLVIRVDASSLDENGESLFVSGLLRPRNPFCLRHGFVEIGVVSPGQNTRRRIFVSSFHVNPGYH